MVTVSLFFSHQSVCHNLSLQKGLTSKGKWHHQDQIINSCLWFIYVLFDLNHFRYLRYHHGHVATLRCTTIQPSVQIYHRMHLCNRIMRKKCLVQHTMRGMTWAQWKKVGFNLTKESLYTNRRGSSPCQNEASHIWSFSFTYKMCLLEGTKWWRYIA